LLYEVLATLWDGPADGSAVAAAIQDRTGERFSAEAAERYLRMLRHNGYVDADTDPFTPRYTINPEGSTLLARLARD
jgi:DNA-binding PadR family transcriptional regulator